MVRKWVVLLVVLLVWRCGGAGCAGHRTEGRGKSNRLGRRRNGRAGCNSAGLLKHALLAGFPIARCSAQTWGGAATIPGARPGLPVIRIQQSWTG